MNRHKTISYIKSLIRIIGLLLGLSMAIGYASGGAIVVIGCLIVAELLGLLEES
jgi:hypothetical protein